MGSTEPLGATNAAAVDGSNIFGVPGGAGVTSLNTRAGAIILLGSASVVITEAPVNTFTFTAVGTGITSINGQVGPAITLSNGVGILVSTIAPGNIQIVNAGVVSVIGNGGPARTGVIQLVDGTNVTIVEGPPGTFTINSAGGGGGITTLNGDPSAAQIINATFPVQVGNAGATHTISAADFTGLSRGIVPLPPASGHGMLTPAGWLEIFSGASTSGPGAPVPDNATTILATYTNPAGQAGNYMVGYGAGLAGVTGNIMGLVLFVNGVVQVGRGVSGMVETTGQTCTIGGLIEFPVFLGVGDTVAIAVSHNGGAGATTSRAAYVQVVRMNL